MHNRSCSELSGPQHLVCAFLHNSGLLWIHRGTGQFQSSWLLFSICSTLNTAALTNPLLSPLLSPFSRDPCDLCSVTAQREHPMLRLPWRWPWRAPVRHTHTQAYTLRQKANDRYSIIRRVARRERGESHCSELTAETRGKLERGVRVTGKWACMCASVCMYEQQMLYLSLDGGRAAPEKFLCHLLKGACPKFLLEVAKWPLTTSSSYLEQYIVYF